MDEARVLELLAAAKQQMATDEKTRLQSAECLSFPRAYALALNPSHWTKAERTHAAQCRTCARLVKGFQREWSEEEVLEAAYDPSHLSTDQLFDYLEKKLNAAARAEVEAHAARCDFCLHQLAELGRLVPLSVCEEESPLLSRIKVMIERLAGEIRGAVVIRGPATAQLVPVLARVREGDLSATPKPICSIVSEGEIAVALNVTMLAEDQCTVDLKAGKPDLENPLAGAECIVLGPEGNLIGNRGFTDNNGCWYLKDACRVIDGDYTVRVSSHQSTTEVVISFATAPLGGGA